MGGGGGVWMCEDDRVVCFFVLRDVGFSGDVI